MTKVQGHPNPEMPRIPARMPNARHFVDRFTTKSFVRAINTFIAPTVDVRGDVDETNAGRAVYDSTTSQYTVNGRTYRQETSGTVYPVSGDGIVGPVGRGVFKALIAYRRYNGVNELAEFEIARQFITADDRKTAPYIWSLRSEKTNEENDSN